MAYKAGDMVRIKDIRDRRDYPLAMRLLSGHCAHIMRVTLVKYLDEDGNEKSYYDLDVDDGKGLWPEYFLEPYQIPNSQVDQEWIDTVLKLIAEIEGKLDQLKRQLWRKKHYGNGNR